MDNKPRIVSRWQNNKTEVVFLEEVKSLKEGFTIPKGAITKVIKVISGDSAIVDYQGVYQWIEIYIGEEIKDK